MVIQRVAFRSVTEANFSFQAIPVVFDALPVRSYGQIHEVCAVVDGPVSVVQLLPTVRTQFGSILFMLCHSYISEMGNESSKAAKASSGKGRVATSLGIGSGPSQSTVQRHIDNARKSRILQLKACGLKSMPSALNELYEVIRNLELSQNKIKELPPDIGYFTVLKQLHLSENALSGFTTLFRNEFIDGLFHLKLTNLLAAQLPDEIGSLKNLEILNLQSNKLSSLPDTIVGCTSLKTLNLSANNFIQFPVPACHLMSLETLNLSQNAITELPDEVSSLNASEMNLNQNRLNFLNADALAKCPHLKILRLEENCLAKTEFTPNLLIHSTVSIINYSGNIFQDREFQSLPGYEEYQERFTATRRKM
ncbi:leucine Rich repeat-containing domain protein [Necator americanus]|uniref:Leucine Rich repeat-containing domain protein n=1 Tax=Necator americanus TaxID=51031 RepID=W2SQ63_NECAM|nr:leucine Rich repeat-containing domain protein [Necator americanus]ETN71026.1 leucine Rich repeat-containing domain protein [Necator americanus]